jgi:hypothetical protein
LIGRAGHPKTVPEYFGMPMRARSLLGENMMPPNRYKIVWAIGFALAAAAFLTGGIT